MSKSLIDAIRRGDLSLVGELVRQGSDVNYRLPAESDHGEFLNQVTPLMVAVSAPKSTAEIVQLLLAKGADPFTVSAGEVTATWYACGGGTGYSPDQAARDALESEHPYHFWGGGSAERLRLMLDAGGDPNEFAKNGRSCVYEACSVGDPSRLELLIQRGAKVQPAIPAFSSKESFRNLFGKDVVPSVEDLVGDHWYQLVPLFTASESGNVECVKLIVEAGFPVQYELGDQNALSKAGSVEVVEYLWEKGVRSKASNFGFDAIDEAIESNNLPIVRFLAGKVDRETVQQKLLIASGVYMNPEAIPVLVEMGADPALPDENFGSPLHYACWQGDGNGGRPTDVVEKTVHLLLDFGADPNLLSRGNRPLHEAVQGDWASPTSVRVLLARGAEVDGRTESGETALILASQRFEYECVQLLLGAGADRSIRDNSGMTALDYAVSHLKDLKKPRFKLFKDQVDKALDFAGIEMAEIRRERLLDAQRVVGLLSGKDDLVG